MRFLIDNALSPQLAVLLHQAGHDAFHVRDYGMSASRDAEIFERAAAEERILVSADTDFGRLLALRSTTKPSVVLFRGATPRLPTEQAKLLVANLAQIENDLGSGALVAIESSRVRIRTLPIQPLE